MDSVGEGGKIWENVIETCEMSCMKRDASPGSVHDARCLGLARWEGPGGWYGEVGREEGSGWGACDFFLKNKKKKKKTLNIKKKKKYTGGDYWQISNFSEQSAGKCEDTAKPSIQNETS